MTGSRRAVTLVEVMVAVAILGLALAPVVGMMHKSFSDIRTEKDEANAAAVAGQILTQILFEIPFDATSPGTGGTIVSNSYTTPAPESQVVLPAGSKTVDGTTVSWTVDMVPVNNLKFLFRRYKYHTQDLGQEPAPGALNDPNKFYIDPGGGDFGDQFLHNKTATQIDKKYSSLPTVMYEIRLTIGWRPPGATVDTRKEMLYVRRAKLD